MKPTDRMREYADDIHDYPELKEVAKQLRKDAYEIDEAFQCSIVLISGMAVLIVMFVIGFISLKSDFDEHLQRDILRFEKQH